MLLNHQRNDKNVMIRSGGNMLSTVTASAVYLFVVTLCGLID